MRAARLGGCDDTAMTAPLALRRVRLAAIVLVAPLLVACSGSDDETPAAKAPTSPCAPPKSSGTFAEPTRTVTYATANFAINYATSAGAAECQVAEKVVAKGTFDRAGSNVQIGLDLGDGALGLSVAVIAFTEDGDKPLALGQVSAPMGISIKDEYFDDSIGQACKVELTELTATTVAGSFACEDVAGALDPVSPFSSGGGVTSTRLVRATGWFRASA